VRLSHLLQSATVAGILGLGLLGTSATPALADHLRTRCDNDGDTCWRVWCDHDWDDCHPVAGRATTAATTAATPITATIRSGIGRAMRTVTIATGLTHATTTTRIKQLQIRPALQGQVEVRDFEALGVRAINRTERARRSMIGRQGGPSHDDSKS
jgi:hypothetical protein